MSKLVNFSEAVLIAMHSMALLAKEKDVQISVKRISKLIGSSENHISKVMQRLAKGGFVSSTRGPSGGFSLAKPADNITLYDIYIEIEGSINQKSCPFDHINCMFNNCLFGNKLGVFIKDMTEYLKLKTLSDVI